MNVRIRWATMDDADFLLSVKNDPIVRKFSIVTHNKIKKKDHVRWLASVIADTDRRLYLIEYEGKRAGDIRFDTTGRWVEVSVRLARKYRRKGIGSFVIPFACRGIAAALPGKTLFAKIVDGNKASARTFEKAGFVFHKQMKGYRLLIWNE